MSAHDEPEVEPSTDPLVEFVQDECPTCGAYMLNPALHADYHARLRQQFIDLDRLARQYVSPPRYGGGL